MHATLSAASPSINVLGVRVTIYDEHVFSKMPGSFALGKRGIFPPSACTV